MKRTVRLGIEDSSARVPARFGKTEFRPEQLILEWANRDDAPDWALIRADVVGTVWKKDGGVGKVPAHRDFASNGDQFSRDAPGWLIELVLRYGPFGPSAVQE